MVRLPRAGSQNDPAGLRLVLPYWKDEVSSMNKRRALRGAFRRAVYRAISAGSIVCACVAGGCSDLGAARALAEGPETSLPEGPGLAARYRGDVGIEAHPAVVFVENFEQGGVDALNERWESISHPEIMAVAEDRPPHSGGRRSLAVRHVGGWGEGAHLYRRLERGYEKLHVRFYVKFDQECGPIHHFFHVGGYHPPTPYPQGGAGVRPRGNDRLTVGIEPHGDAWKWDYYAYWMEMRGSPPRGQTWGNTFLGQYAPDVARGQWICMEVMIRLNDPQQRNGELALWADGRLVSHLRPGFPKGKWVFDRFLPDEGGDAIRWNDARGDREPFIVADGGEPFEGFRWRSDESLKLNFIWVLVYITRAPRNHVSQVWFDDIVAATEYIGPHGVGQP